MPEPEVFKTVEEAQNKIEQAYGDDGAADGAFCRFCRAKIVGNGPVLHNAGCVGAVTLATIRVLFAERDALARKYDDAHETEIAQKARIAELETERVEKDRLHKNGMDAIEGMLLFDRGQVTRLTTEIASLKSALAALEEAVDEHAPKFYATTDPAMEGSPFQQLASEMDARNTPLGRLETAMKNARSCLARKEQLKGESHGD